MSATAVAVGITISNDRETAEYTFERLLECGIDTGLVLYLCERYDENCIDKNFFKEMKTEWEKSPDNPVAATSALELMMVLIDYGTTKALSTDDYGSPRTKNTMVFKLLKKQVSWILTNKTKYTS